MCFEIPYVDPPLKLVDLHTSVSKPVKCHDAAASPINCQLSSSGYQTKTALELSGNPYDHMHIAYYIPCKFVNLTYHLCLLIGEINIPIPITSGKATVFLPTELHISPGNAFLPTELHISLAKLLLPTELFPTAKLFLPV